MAYNSKYTGAQIDEAVNEVSTNKEKWNKPSASNVYFSDGDTFQEKYNSGELKGAKGDKGDKGDTGAPGSQGEKGKTGDSGATFTPSVSSAGVLSWTNNKGLTNPTAVNIKGAQGAQGIQGVQGAKGDKGDTGVPGANGTSVTVSSVSESSADGGSNVVTFSDGKKLTVKNGKTGATGAPGEKGEKGDKGDKGDKGSDATVTVDNALSASSTNPIQNKAVTAAVNENKEAIETAERVIAAVSEAGEETADSLYQHVHDKANPHNVTASQVGAPTVAQMNDAIAAASLGGGGGTGGGGGAGSWEDLGEGISMGTILEETTLTSVTTNLTEELGLIVGNTYTVKWNGTDYTPTATDASAMANAEGSILLGMSSGYPFTILVKPGSGTMITVDRGSTPVTVSVTGVGHIAIPIPGRYLPKGTPWIEESGMVEILPEYTINSEADMAGIPRLGLVAGNTYTVKLQGMEFTCVAWAETVEGLAVVGLGDIYTFSGGEIGTTATGEPFVLMEVPPEMAAQVGINVMVQPLVAMEFPVVFSITGGGATVHKLDNRCLDLAWLPTTEKVEVEVLATTNSYAYNSNPTLNRTHLLEGDEVIVIFDSVEYRTSVYASYSMLQFGDYNFVAFPFFFQSGYDGAAYTLQVGDDEDHAVSVIKIETVYNEMPDDFLPSSVKVSDVVSLSAMGLGAVPANTEVEFEMDVSDIIKVLDNGGRVPVRFEIDFGGTRRAPTAMFDGTKMSSEYYWSTTTYVDPYGLYVFYSRIHSNDDMGTYYILVGSRKISD